MQRFPGRGSVFFYRCAAQRDSQGSFLTCLQIAVNDIHKHASVVEGLARIAELICRFAVVEELYLQGTSKAAQELDRAVVRLYSSILGYLSQARQYLEQGTASMHTLSTRLWMTPNYLSERTVKSAFFTETQLDSDLDEIQTAEMDADRCMTLVERNG
jgi:hypothetical protein